MKPFAFLSFAFSFLFLVQIQAQENDSVQESYQFSVLKEIPTTPVKNQYRSGTCWSFATTSFIESELLRMGKPEMDISEIYFVNHAYREKADLYVRMHGSSNFGPGGQAHDVINIVAEHGLVTEQDYPGLLRGETKHLHGELDAALKGYLDVIIKNKDGQLSQVWPDAINTLLDTYLGKLPEKAANNFGFKPEDYIELTSYSHHPYYTTFQLEIPDNWSHDTYYNIPLDDLMEVMYNAIEQGYTIAWDGDVSDKGFSHSKGVAIVPDKHVESLEGTERSRWEKLTEREQMAELYTIEKPGNEKTITPEMRQEAFNNYKATDDHLMHITGIAKDQNDTRYFITKNSWADNSNEFGGYLRMSESYVRLNTIAIMVHKDAVPKRISQKAGF